MTIFIDQSAIWICPNGEQDNTEHWTILHAYSTVSAARKAFRELCERLGPHIEMPDDEGLTDYERR
jgi:hypothetical protein